MVKEEKKQDKTLYMCEECNFYYEDKEWADKCEDFCKEHKSCSIEITKHALQLPKNS